MPQVVSQKGVDAPHTDRTLDSWKEIAVYLGRAVRTVQTWEKEEGLPVHRHQHGKMDTVYAYASEIDAWRLSRDRLDNAGTDTPWRRSRWLQLGTAGIFAAVVFGISWWFLDDTAGLSQRFPDFEERDWLLIADFDNRTGESSLDDTLEAALYRELVNSDFVNVAPRARIENTLRLMRAPLDVRVDAKLAREVALRDGGIRAVLTGRAEKVGSTYLLSIDLHKPADGAVVVSLSEEALGHVEILPAVASLSVRVRDTLGEVLPRMSSSTTDLAQVSTPSLRALELYSRANQLLEEQDRGGPDQNQAAEQLLREAIAQDPGFASSYTHLAWTLQRQGRPPEEYLPHAEKAVDLADRATIVERYFIRGSHHSMRSISPWFLDAVRGPAASDTEAQAALAHYQALLQLDPGHFWASENLRQTLRSLGRRQELRDHLIRLAEVTPNDPRIMAQLAWELVLHAGDLDAARPFVARARRLQEDLAIEPFWDGFLEFFSVHEHWVEGDAERVVGEVDAIVESLGRRALASRSIAAVNAALFYLDLGMFEKAEAVQARHRCFSPDLWSWFVAWRRGDKEFLRGAHVGREDGDPLAISYDALNLSQLGFLAEAELLLEGLPDELDRAARGNVLAARGNLDLARSRPEEALPQLQAAAALLRDREDFKDYFTTVRALSRAWEALGQPRRAVSVLEEASREKSRLLWERAFWMEARLRLAELYRKLGDDTEALAIEGELRRYCAYADPDFPILLELDKRKPQELAAMEAR
ncbi:MAG: hypothetical protein OEM62_05930 [Acidobacteriota bacterium]|nr:hypothetical protein [Acidobacteriota bacterium]